MNSINAKKMMAKFAKRVQKEKITNSENDGFKFNTIGDINWYFQFTIQDGIYRGQRHIINVKLVSGQDPDLYVYPINAPLCTFVTPIWHPNISEKGTICLDILKDNWSPVMYTATIISAITVLLNVPEPSSAQNAAAAQMMKEPDIYVKKITEFYNYEHAPQDIRALFE